MTDLRRDISLFVSVAKIEAALHAHRVALQKIPNDIAGVDRALADLDARDKATQANLEELSKSRRNVEKTLREHEDHLKKSKGQQSLVKTNEEYTAMLKEIANLEKQIGDEEEQLLILMDRIETAQKDSVRTTEALKNDRAVRSGERATLESKLTSLKSEVERLAGEKPKLLREVSAPLLKRYERLSEKHRDVAVTRVDSDHCGGCGQQLPPQLAVEIRKNDQFITCPACGRILIHYAD